MDSHVRDFEMRARSDTAAPGLQRHPTSPVDQNPLRRTSTGGSMLSTVSSHGKPHGMHRSNTAKTFRPAEMDGRNWQPGAEPGVDTTASDDAVPDEYTRVKATCEITIVDYSDTDVRNVQADNATLAEALEQPRPDDLPCRWISV